MKKILFSSLFVAVLSMFFTGCLKDKGFENFEYGINDPGTQPPGVGFSFGTKSKTDYGLEVSASPQVVNEVVNIAVLSGSKPASAVNVTLANTTAAQVAAYNTANGTAILAMPSALYAVANALVIPAGSQYDDIPLTISNTTSLDPNKQYAIGLNISAVDGGYKIADNMKNLLIVFSVKNKYDGKYLLKGVHNRTPFTFPFSTPVEMWTTGPSSVAMFWPTGGDFGQPIGVGPGATNWYGNAVSPNFQFDAATNLCTGVSLQVGNAVTLAMVNSDPVIGPIVNRYEPGPKKMYLVFQYNNNDLRRFYDTLTYTGPR